MSRIEIREIQFRINAVHVEIQRHRDDVQIARALAIAEQRAFHAIRAREQAEFRRRHARAAVIVRVQADDERFAIFEVAAHPLDLVRINIRHRHLHRVRQIQDHLVLRRRLPHIHDRLGNFLREFHFRQLKLSGEYWSITSVPLSRVQTVLDPSARPARRWL